MSTPSLSINRIDLNNGMIYTPHLPCNQHQATGDVRSTSRKIAFHQVKKLPKNLLKSQASQDVFVMSDDNGRIELAKSSHVGHQLFKSLAELNRPRFVDNVNNDPERRISNRIALQLLNYITDKGRGKIFCKILNDNDGWKEVTDHKEGRKCVFGTLLSLYGMEDPAKAILKEEEIVRSPPSSPKRSVDHMRSDSPESLPPKKRVRFDSPSLVAQQQHPNLRRISSKSFDAATTLACLGSDEDGLSNDRLSEAPHAMPCPSALIFVDSALPDSTSTAQAKLTLQQKMLSDRIKAMKALVQSNGIQPTFENNTLTHQSLSPTHRVSSPVLPPPQSQEILGSQHGTTSLSVSKGITASQLRPNDIIVGGSGVGVLDLPSTGNRNFRSLIQSKIDIFSKFDKRTMLHMAQVTVSIVHEAGGRFLAINSQSSLLQEVKKDTAWSKTLRTYKEYTYKKQELESVRKLQEAIHKQESLERTEFGFGSGRDRVQQMLEEAQAQQAEVKKSDPTVPVFNNARVVAFSAKLRQLSPPQG